LAATRVREPEDVEPAPPGARRAAWLAGAIVFAIDLATTSHRVLPADPGEFQTMSQVGGISHSGYAPVVLLLRVFGALPLGTPAFRANLLSCVAGAVAVALLAYVGARFTRRPAAAIVAALAFALSRSAWKESTEAGVHAVTLALDAVVFVLLLRFVRRPDKRGAFFMGLAGGLAALSHLSAWSLVPVVLAAGIALARTRRLRAAHVALAALGVVLGLSTLITMLASDRPAQPMNYLEDVMRLEPAEYFPNAPVPVTRLERATWLMTGRQYLAFPRPAGYVAPTRNDRLIALAVEETLNQFPLLGLPFAALGAWWLIRRRVPWAWLAIVWAASALVLTNTVTSGFPNGYFFLPGAWCVGLGIAGALAFLAERAPRAVPVAAALVLLAPLARLARAAPPPPLDRFNLTRSAWHMWPEEWSPLIHDRTWDTYGRRVMAELPPRASVLAGWDEGNVLRYFLYAEPLRRDVRVVLTGAQPKRIAHAFALATFPRAPGTADSLEFVAVVTDSALWRIERVTPRP
jgi:Protein O-mannosyl-transferase TMEM260-like